MLVVPSFLPTNYLLMPSGACEAPSSTWLLVFHELEMQPHLSITCFEPSGIPMKWAGKVWSFTFIEEEIHLGS